MSAAFIPSPADQHHSATNGVLRQPVDADSNGADQLATGLERGIAMTPPHEGPAVTVQRPSVSTPIAPQPQNRFPNPAANPFRQNMQSRELNSSGTPSPGDRTPTRTPTNSRAAKAYTPTPPLIPRENPMAQPAPLHSAQVMHTPVVNDAPTPLNQNRQPVEHPAARAFREAAYNTERQSQTRAVDPAAAQPDKTAHDRVTTTPAPTKQPEMQQTNRRASPFIKMQSPDPRPPSDESIPIPTQPIHFTDRYQSGPSMPSLQILESMAQTNMPPNYNLPQANSPQSYVPPTQERPRRGDRPRSQSQPRAAPPDAIPAAPETTSRSTTPVPKKSVAFGPVEFSEAPKPQDRAYSDEESPEASRRRHDRDQDNSSRSRSKRERDKSYEAGDDFSDDTPMEDHRRRDRDRDRDRDRGNRSSSRRERRPQSLDNGAGPSSRDRDKDKDKQRDPKRSNTVSSRSGSSRSGDKGKERGKSRDESPGSDETEDLPERFDEKGRPKQRTPDEDAIASGLDKIFDMLVTNPTGRKSSSSKRR